MNIIFIHRGDSWYLSYALNQAKKTNPSANIVLLGDESNSKYANIIKHDLISSYFYTADSFSKIYKHYSTTNYNHELFCIQRWFVWLEYMKIHNLENAILPDTDVLIFRDISIYYSQINYDFHFSKGCTNYMGFVYVKIKYLEKICEFITSQYLNIEHLLELEKAYIDYVKVTGYGGVSDITLFDRYEREHPNCALNFEMPPINGFAFIHSLNTPYYAQNKDGYVNLKWRKGNPYAKLLSGEDIAIMGVHCFGLQKVYIRKLYQGSNWFIARLIYYWKKSVLKLIFDKLRGRR
jgi:hypothetical protein